MQNLYHSYRILIITQKIDINDDILGFFHGWLEKLAGKFKQLVVICLQKGDYDLPRNVKVLSLSKERGKSKIKYLINFYRFIYRERKNYDTVFVHMNPIYITLGGLLWKLWHKKIVLWYTHKAVNLKLRIAEKLTNIIFTASKESFRLKSKKVVITGHGIDINIFKSIKSGDRRSAAFQIVTIGRISPVKDCETLIKAVDILVNQKNIKNLEVKIIGSPALPEDEVYLKGLKELIKRKRLGQVLRFIGPKPNRDIIEFLQTADLFVNMSHTGSLDKAVLEAMACGLPILTCNEAFGNVLRKYAETLMYSKKDFKFLAKKIKFITELDSKNKEILTRNLRRIVVENHSLNNLIEKMSLILKS